MDVIEDLIPLRLVRLTSSLLPVGAFAYSRGLEDAIHSKSVSNTQDLRDWVFGTLRYGFSPLDGAIFLRLMEALHANEPSAFRVYDQKLAAARESHELLLEDRRMAEAFIKLLRDLDVCYASDPDWACQTYPAAYALAVADMDVSAEAGLQGLMWSVCEAQISAAIRLGLIGQTDGQRLLSAAPAEIVVDAQIAAGVAEADIGNLCFMLSVGSARHETQYSRLFRS